MQAPYELRLLAAYRGRGQSPQLPVFVTTMGYLFVSNIRASGAYVIPVRDIAAAPQWNWAPVAGLEVILSLHVSNVELARAVASGRPRRLRYIDWSAPLGERITAIMS